MQTFVAYGSWKLRHNEPLDPADQQLILYPIAPIQTEAKTVLLNLTSEVRIDAGLLLSDSQQAADGIVEGHIPLVLVQQADTALHITHALCLIDAWNAQFLNVSPFYVDEPGIQLWQRIYQLHEHNHHVFSNHERYFIKARETTELEQKIQFSTPQSYMRVVQCLYQALDDGDIPGFRPKYTQEFQNWSYDNYLYEILPNPQDDAGYVSVLCYCTKKHRWNDPVYMYKKKVYNEDSLERWERNYKNQWVDRDKKELLEEYFGYPIRELPPWRRSRCDLGVESIVHGNVFMINIDICQIHDGYASVQPLQQCEIEYLKTRGVPQLDAIYEDFWSLVGQVRDAFKRMGIDSITTHYSKLTWLRDVEVEM